MGLKDISSIVSKQEIENVIDSPQMVEKMTFLLKNTRTLARDLFSQKAELKGDGTPAVYVCGALILSLA